MVSTVFLRKIKYKISTARPLEICLIVLGTCMDFIARCYTARDLDLLHKSSSIFFRIKSP